MEFDPEAEEPQEAPTVTLMDDTTSEESEEEMSATRRERLARAKKKRARQRAACPITCTRYTVINKVRYGDVKLVEYDTIDCRGAIVVEGVPSEGLPSSIAAQYFIDELNLPLVGELFSCKRAQTCLIRQNQPSHSIRIYGDRRIVIFTSQTQLEEDTACALVDAVYDFSQRHHCKSIITLEGVMEALRVKLGHGESEADIMRKLKETTLKEKPKPLRFLSNNAEIAKRLQDMGHKAIRGAVITGVTGGILARASTSSVDVTGLLAPFSPLGGHARGALNLVQCIAMFASISIDYSNLEEDAEDLEGEIRKVFDKPEGPKAASKMSSMYI